MIHVLLVSPGAAALEGLSGQRSSVEVLLARDPEEAAEKLARNRRVDAVLLLSGAGNADAVRAIREDTLAPPPFFAAASSPELDGVRRLPAETAAELLDLVARELSGA